MTTVEDIIAAIESEKQKQKAFSVQHPDLAPKVGIEDIVKAHQSNVNPGRGGQRIGSDSKLGAPSSGANIEALMGNVKDFWHIPGLKQALKNDRR
jgi:hypothetical protein